MSIRLSRRVRLLSLISATTLFSSFSAFGGSAFNYVGPDGGDWNTAANWSLTPAGPGGDGIPGDTDSATLTPDPALAGTESVTFDSNFTAPASLVNLTIDGSPNAAFFFQQFANSLAAANVTIAPTGPAAYLQSGGSVAAGNLTIGAQGIYVLAGGNLSLSGNISNVGALTWSAGAADLSAAQSLTNSGVIDIQGDLTPTGNTTLTLTNSGTFKKSAGTGISTINAASFSNTGTLEVDSGTLSLSALASASTATTIIGITSPTASGHLAITGVNPTALAGALILASSNTYTPKVGDSFPLLSATGTLTGQFSSVTDTSPLPANVGIAMTYTPTAVTATITFLGDANLDGTVNIADLNVVASDWQKSVNSWSQGDFNGDGVVNIADLNIIAANWQAGAGSGSSGSGGSLSESLTPAIVVPEPTTLALLGFASLVLLKQKRK